jgi:two-component system cell cycle sensor histidine kinase/response regulator CckA
MTEPLRVLILDDVATDAQLVQRALKRSGIDFVARHVGDEPTFLRSLEEFQPDVVLSDYSLPGYDGLSALAAVRARDPSLPFIVVTGSLTEETAADCIKAGASDYVIKEHLVRLPVAIRSALDHRRAEVEGRETRRQAEEERERLLTRERSQREAAETLAAATLALAQRQDLQSILDTLLDYLERLVPSDSSMVLLLRGDQMLEVGALRGYERWSDPQQVRRVLFDARENRLLRDVLESRSPIVVLDTRTDPRWEWTSEGGHVRCWLGVPLVVRGQAIGIYSLDRTRPGAFTSEHVQHAMSLAPAAATAVEMARLLREAHEATEFSQQQNRILERIAANAPLSETLPAVARFVESACPEALCTILLLEEDGLHVRHAAAPGMPEAFTQAVDQQGIGPKAGSCGTAMYRREVVEVEDILEHPLWEDFRHLAAIGGVRACWSTPILADDGRVLGSFAIYYRTARRPDPLHRRVVDIAASVVGIALQRSRTEETLRRGSARLKAVIDAAMDAVIGMDDKGRVLSWNPQAEAIFGWSADEAVGRQVSDLIIPPNMVDAHQRGIAHYLETRESAMIGRRIELTALRRDRTLIPVELTLVALEEAGGVVFTAFIADISERKDSARRLAESEERFRQIAENVREVVWMTGPLRQDLVYVSPAYEAIWGRSCGSLYADPASFASAIVPEDRDRVLAAADRQAEGDYAEIYRIVQPDGGTRWIHERAFPVRGMSGEVVRVVGSAQDITNLKRAEEALRDSESRYRNLFESAPDGIFVADAEGRFVDVNPSGLRLLGASREELLGRTLADLVPPQDAVAAVEAMFEVRHGVAHHGEWRLRRGDDSFVDAEVIGSSTADGRFLSLVRDVGDRKRMEEQLRQSQKMEAVGRLAGGIAHDFNNILGVVTGYGEMVRRKLPEDHPDRRRLEEILKAAERGGGLTRQLLAFSRKQVLAPRVLEPSVVVTETRKLLAPLVGEDVEVSVKAEAKGRVRVDRGQLEQVLLNLVVNARDAMAMGGWLSIETRDVELDQEYMHRREVAIQPGKYVVISVADSGHGMDESTRARIFEPFFTTKPEGKGTGLGLATVYGIVKQSGGYIWAYSEVGYGTTFHVYLPRVEDAVSVESLRAAPRRRVATETILVVEDERAARELVAEILRAEGYMVLLAADGQEAVDMAAQSTVAPDLLLTDVILPKISGRLAAERIRAIHPRVKVLYMSGYTDDEVSRHGVLDPGIVLLQKPFTPDELISRVGEVLDDR